MGMSADPSAELKSLEAQGEALLKAALLIAIYELFTQIVSSDAELLLNQLMSSTSLEIVQQTTSINEALRRIAQLAAPAVLPSLIVHATRRSSFDAVQSAVVEAFAERASIVHDKLPILRARASLASPPRAVNVVSSPLDPPPATVKVDSSYISKLNEWASGRPERHITWEDTATGPSHMRIFEVICYLNGEVIGRGKGSKKQIGKAQAAYDAAKYLGITVDPYASMLHSLN